MKLLDYFFYRIFSFYKEKRDATPVLMGCLVIAVVLVATAFSVLSVFDVLTRRETQVDNIFIVAVLLLLLVLNWKRYSNKLFVDRLEKRYKDEKIGHKRLRSWGIILYMVLVIIIPISVGYLRHNLGLKI